MEEEEELIEDKMLIEGSSSSQTSPTGGKSRRAPTPSREMQNTSTCCSAPLGSLSALLPHFSSMEEMVLHLNSNMEFLTASSSTSPPSLSSSSSSWPVTTSQSGEGQRQTDTSSPLHFLAQASAALQEEIVSVSPDVSQKRPESAQSESSPKDPRGSPLSMVGVEGRERITVVPLATSLNVRLHKGAGRLLATDLSKPFAKKCRNRECNNLGGQLGKPRSIYCSKRCQSREQNLRQGRIKNVRSFSPSNASVSPFEGGSFPALQSVSPSPTAAHSFSPIAMSASPSPSTSHSLRHIAATLPASTPSMRISSPSANTLSSRSARSQSVSPAPSAFSPVPMSSSIPQSTEMAKPILFRPTTLSSSPHHSSPVVHPKPKPATPASIPPTSGSSAPVSMGANNPSLPKPEAHFATSPVLSSFTAPQKRKSDLLDEQENLTLAPIRSS